MIFDKTEIDVYFRETIVYMNRFDYYTNAKINEDTSDSQFHDSMVIQQTMFKKNCKSNTLVYNAIYIVHIKNF